MVNFLFLEMTLMLLSEFYKFIFIKTHKTASTAVELALEPYCAPPDHLIFPNRRNPLISDYGIIGARAPGVAMRLESQNDVTFFWNHMSAKKIIQRISYEKFMSMRRLTSVRNPFSRLVSQFYYQQACSKNKIPEISSDLSEARNQFDRWLHDYEESGLKNGCKKIHCARSDYSLVHFGGKFIVTDFVRVESIKDDLNAFCGKCGIDANCLKISSERDNSANKKFNVKQLFCSSSMIDQARKIDSWVFELDLYPDAP